MVDESAFRLENSQIKIIVLVMTTERPKSYRIRFEMFRAKTSVFRSLCSTDDDYCCDQE